LTFCQFGRIISGCNDLDKPATNFFKKEQAMNNIPFYVAGWLVSGIDGALIWFIKTANNVNPLAYIAAAAFTYMALHLAIYSAIKK
jgi:hypothetical protein